MKCAHCGASKATERWTVQVCADKRVVRRKWLCVACDVALNALVLAFFNDPAAGDKVARYKGVRAQGRRR